jgi:amidohydrolase
MIFRLLRDYFEKQKQPIQELRRELHQIPELGFEEIETSAFVIEHLKKLGVQYEGGIGKTGIIASLGKPSGKVIALRADMDGLPIEEENHVSYYSRHPGRMHACGHDAHVAMLLGVVEYLKSIENEINGQVLCVFQPGEERSDGTGLTGARHILNSGKLAGAKAILGLHVMPAAPTGKFGIIPGGAMASGDLFNATIYGKGGHDAWVHETIDPIFITTQVLNAIYAIRSRKIDPLASGTLSVGTIEGGTTANVIPESVKFSGTIRTFDQKIRDIFVAELENALKLSETFGGRYALDIPFHVPVTQNSPELADKIALLCRELFGDDCLAEIKPCMGVEDFSWYSLQMPALFIILGAQMEGESRVAHNPRFDIDDSILYRGSALLSAAALSLLREA